MQLRNMQCSGIDGTYTATMETEEVDTGALVGLEVTVDQVTIFEPGRRNSSAYAGARVRRPE